MFSESQPLLCMEGGKCLDRLLYTIIVVTLGTIITLLHQLALYTRTVTDKLALANSQLCQDLYCILTTTG